MIKKSFDNQNPTLYIIATPIGNLSDISKRMIETIKEVSVLLCEDTRVTGNLIKKLEITNKPKLVRYDLVKENNITDQIIQMFSQHEKIGLVSDAGTPLISDPGFPLINKLKQTNINVVVIPGPIAYTSALVASGFSTTNYFHGFLPNKKSQRSKLFNQLSEIKQTLIFYVSCFKLKKSIEELKETFPNKEIFVAKELTKLHETYYFGTADEVLSDLPKLIKGEYVLLINNKEVK